MKNLWNSTLGWLKWVYDWLTVLSVSLIGTLASLGPFLDSLGYVDFSSYLSPERAMRYALGMAVFKGLCALAQTAHAKWAADKEPLE